MNEHESIRKLLPLAVSGDLSPEEMRRVREHLDSCPTCRRVNEEFSGLGEALRDLPTPQLRAEFAAQVRDLAESALARKREESKNAIHLAPLVAASWIVALATWPLARSAVHWIFTWWYVPGGGFVSALTAYSILGFVFACVSAYAVGRRAHAIGRIK